MSMDYKGLIKDTVLGLLKDYLKEDFTYDSGRILGSMCTSPILLQRESSSKP